MRWFKHLTCSHRDEEMAEVISTLGPEGYGVWWIILEAIGEQMDGSGKCSVKYSAKKWGSFCGFSAKKFQKFAENLAEISSLSVEKKENFLQIECRNLLKYRDEYSKKSGQTPDKLRTNSGARDRDRDRIQNTDKKPFLLFWQAYPKKVGKGAAETAWKKIRCPAETLPLILQAIENQKSGEQWQKNNGQFIPNPSTWLNQRRWEDEPIETISQKQGFPTASMSRGAQAQAVLDEMKRRLCDGEMAEGGDYQRHSNVALPAPSGQTGSGRNTEDHGNVVDVNFKEAREIDSGAS